MYHTADEKTHCVSLYKKNKRKEEPVLWFTQVSDRDVTSCHAAKPGQVNARWAYPCVRACASVCWGLHVVTINWSHKEQSCPLPEPTLTSITWALRTELSGIAHPGTAWLSTGAWLFNESFQGRPGNTPAPSVRLLHPQRLIPIPM